MANEHSRIISEEMNIMRKHVSACLRLLDSGATVPFISRYRKEMTGGMDDVTVEKISLRHRALSEIEARKTTILKAAQSAGKLTPELKERIEQSWDPIVLEDIYLPFKPRRQTKAQAAIDKGLEPLARLIFAQNSADIKDHATCFVSSEVPDIENALAGACDIMAQWISESEKVRSLVRSRYQRSATISSTVVPGKEAEAHNYENYFDFSEPLRSCTSHRYLAMRRGEREGLLKIKVAIDDDEMVSRLTRMMVHSTTPEPSASLVRQAVKDGYRRLIKPSIENEVCSAVKQRSDAAAIQLFADNVKQLLMASPLPRHNVLAIDPGFKTGCKVAVLDRQGNLLDHDVIFPTAPANDFLGATDALCYYINKYDIDVIAIGNGTAGRETENFIRTTTLPRKMQVVMVSEAGASIYSASEIARKEFPDLDETVRSAASIGRRLQDPLAELVKIDPKSIGVGQYQHDVDQGELKDSLDFVVSSCVNSVGVNLNTASEQLLSYVSGIGPSLAANIVKYRAENGDFLNRQQLMNVPRMGEKAFEQCAGFLRIDQGTNPLDRTGIHPEQYALVTQIADDRNTTVEQLLNNKNLVHNIDLQPYVSKTVGLPTLTDIILELEKPGRDPRERDEKEEEIYAPGIASINDLHLGMELTGKVNNITAFGAFVDLGLKENGMLHVSQISSRFIKSPNEAVSIGQKVRVKVIDIDTERGRIALTMKDVPQQ